MNHSRPAKRVQLISIGANGATIDDLLTVRITRKLKWLARGVSIGDANVGPAQSLLEVFADLPTFFDRVDLEPIEDDGLENLLMIGGDADGHEYVLGTKSQRFYVLWHDPSGFEQVAATSKSFLQWVIRERADHLQGCPWEVFTIGSIYIKDIWHRDRVDSEPILKKARSLLQWDREYVSPLGFNLLSLESEVDLRFENERRGHNSYIRVIGKEKLPEVESFLAWLRKRGFGRVWS